MTYFSPDFAQFFKDLAANNNKEWFDENRKRYEKEVKDAFKNLVEDLIITMRKEEPELLVEAKDCIFRINRDVRLCHPPGSVDIVEKIIEDFKSGKESHAPFWIQMKGKFILIEAKIL